MTWETLAAILAGVCLLAAALRSLPTVWAFVKALAKAPVMVERMYGAFAPNGGSSMPEVVNRLADGQDRIVAWQEDHQAEDLVRLTEIATTTAGAVTATKELTEYTHSRMHDLLNKLAPLAGWGALHDKRLATIEALVGESGKDVKEIVAEARQSAKDLGIQIGLVHDEVRTMNGLTMGAMADQDETRRIEDKAPAERTDAEQQHIEAVLLEETP